MANLPFFSFLIPVYNRPDEVEELLDSLKNQTIKNFEVIIVEDGSTLKCDKVVDNFSKDLSIQYYFKENSGPSDTRNYGSTYCRGEYLLILDSDCVLPPSYLENVWAELQNNPCDAFGGPDRAHKSFSPIQKAISYSMTSFFTTGGIRGGKKKLDKFYPRSFNLGIRHDVYKNLGGFSKMRFGEDIDLSIRIFDSGYSCRLFPNAWVYHKRRTDFRKFFKQVHNSGIARINLYKRHPKSLKLVHLLPAAFTIGVILLIILSCIDLWFLLPIFIYSLLIFIDASMKEHSLKISGLSILASFIQLFAYGTGFLRAVWKRLILKQDEFEAYKKNFYK